MSRKNKTTQHQSFTISNLFCNKRRFRNEKEAQAAAEIQMLQDMSLELSVYKCDLCRYWHLTRNIENKF